jgi:hypothetical protein
MRGITVVAFSLAALTTIGAQLAAQEGVCPSDAEVRAAFGRQGMRIAASEAASIRSDVRLALAEARRHGIGNSKVDFSAVEIAHTLGLDTSPGSSTVRNVVAAIRDLFDAGRAGCRPAARALPLEWSRYYDRTLGLWHDRGFMGVVHEKGFHPVKISWEDIGRYEGSVWGDRISDVGIWVREQEDDPDSAQLALSVRRDSNFRDKVLVVPAAAIKVHERVGARTVEKTLAQRLSELGLASETRDRHVIVSNQFAIVPVPARGMPGASAEGKPPRAAFTFSIFPYGSTNFVITDVIEGSHEAIVGPGQHQLLFANVSGRKAPFTASRAEDRQDLLKLERQLRAQGMDVDVQRYYLVQVPLRRDATGVRLSNMGTPPWRSFQAIGGVLYSAPMAGYGVEGGVPGGVVGELPVGELPEAPAITAPSAAARSAASPKVAREEQPGLARVAIGHGEAEGPYDAGAGQRGARADEPVRVTVVYFVTPVGEVTRKDMDGFAAAFARWDKEAIWGGSFVTKETL